MSLPPSNGKIILVSGVNSYIGSAIGLDLLKKGYTLRGTSRAKESADALLNGAYKHYADRVQMYSVPVMTVPGAFDEAVKGVTAIIHVASPLSFNLTTWNDFVVPAVGGAMTILNSALHHAGPQLTSFVLTSSIAAVNDPSKTAHAFTEADWNEYSLRTCHELGDRAPPGLLYMASKTSAEKAVWQWRNEHKPAFSISAVNPGVVIGPPIQPPPSPANLNATLAPVWSIFSGATPTIPPGIGSATYIDVRDVAAMHVWCAEHPVEAANQRFLMANGRAPPQAVADVLRKWYPERRGVIPEGRPGEGYVEGFGWGAGNSYESGKARGVLGRGFVGFEESLVQTVRVFERYL